MEGKYVVTANIHLGNKHSKIPIRIHFLVAESKIQLVFYWTVVDDLHRILGSSQVSNFFVSFSVEPEDGNLQVTKFGVRVIDKEYILRRQESKVIVGRGMSQTAILSREFFNGYEVYGKMDHHIQKIVDLSLGNGRKLGFLDDIYQITKGLLKIKKAYFSYLNDYAMGYYSYYVISLGASVLYKDFIQSVKDINDGWLSVKLALEQIMVKTSGDNCSYKEILQQLNDLEVAKSVGFSDKFITMLESIFMRTFDMVDGFGMVFSSVDKFLRKNLYFVSKGKVFAKLPVIITSVLCTVAAHMSDFELLEAMKQKNLWTLFLHLVRAFTDKKHIKDGIFIMKTHSNCELQISDFSDNGILLQELINKMARSSCFTQENNKEMMRVIDKLQKNIHKVTNTIEHMSSHAKQYSHDLEKVKKHVKDFSVFSINDDIISMLPLFDYNK